MLVTEPSLQIYLNGSGLNDHNLQFLSKLKEAVPPREFTAIASWVATFYGFQQNWLFDTNRFSVLVKCRQIGASHTYAAAAVLWALLGENTSVVSIGQREADEVLEKVKRHAEALVALGSKWATKVAESSTRVALASGGTIYSLPSTSGGRGKSGNVLLDEAAYYEHPDEVWDGASATAMHGYRMRIMSTPNGVGNMFHGLVKNHESLGFKLHRVDLTEALRDGLPVTEAECRKMAKGDDRLFSQLFSCSFLDSNLQYIPSAAIEACSMDGIVTDGDGAYYAGLDIGKTADLTVLIVLRKWLVPATGKDDRRTLFVVESIQSMKRTDSDGLEAMVSAAFRKYDLRRLCVDATGMGAFPAERLRKRHGLSKVEPIGFTLQVKEDLATALYTAFIEQTIRLPLKVLPGSEPGEPEKLREDIASLRRIITIAGNVRYDAPHTDEGHADRAWSLAMALHAAMTAPTYARM